MSDPASYVTDAYGPAGRAAGEAALEHARDGVRIRSITDAYALSRVARACVEAAAPFIARAAYEDGYRQAIEDVRGSLDAWKSGFGAGMVPFDAAYFDALDEGQSRTEATKVGAHALLDAFVKFAGQVAEGRPGSGEVSA